MDYTFSFQDVWANFDMLLAGAWTTVWLSAASIAIGTVVGVAGAVFRTSRSRLLRAVAAFYVEGIRNTPFLVQIFIVYFGLPLIGLRFTPNGSALVAMVVNLGAYATEIIRAGIEATHRSQIEAGLALGMTRFQIFRHIVLLPALERVYPALASQFILLMLASSIVSQISAEELTGEAALLDARTYRSFEIYLVVTGIYLTLTFLFRIAFRLIALALFRRRRRLGFRT